MSDEFTRPATDSDMVSGVDYEELGYVSIAGEEMDIEQAREMWELEGEIEPDVYEMEFYD